MKTLILALIALAMVGCVQTQTPAQTTGQAYMIQDGKDVVIIY